MEVLKNIGLNDKEFCGLLKTLIEKRIKDKDIRTRNKIQRYLDYSDFYVNISHGKIPNTRKVISMSNKVEKTGNKLIIGRTDDILSEKNGYHYEKIYETGRIPGGWYHYMTESKMTRISKSSTYQTRVNKCRSIVIQAYGCVYLLIHQNDIVYIGESMTPTPRIHGHSKKVFDTVCILPCILDNRKELERKLIQNFKPKHNKKHNPDWYLQEKKRKMLKE